MAEGRLPKYRAGDFVTIKKFRKEESHAYRFSFTDDMVKEYGGKRYKIEEAVYWDDDPCVVPDDGYRYRLEGADFSWASSMFEESSMASPSWISDSPDDSDISAFIRTKECPKLDFNL